MDRRPSREIVHAIVSVVRRGCAWRMLPHDVPPWLTVYPSVRRWREDATRARRTDTLRMEVRRASGREKELGDQETGAGEAGEQVLGFRTGEDGGEAFGFAGAQGLDRLSDFPSEDLAIKDSLEDLMLGRGGDVFVDSQVGEKGFDFLSAHFLGGGVYRKRGRSGITWRTRSRSFGAEEELAGFGGLGGL